MVKHMSNLGLLGFLSFSISLFIWIIHRGQHFPPWVGDHFQVFKVSEWVGDHFQVLKVSDSTCTVLRTVPTIRYWQAKNRTTKKKLYNIKHPQTVNHWQ